MAIKSAGGGGTTALSALSDVLLAGLAAGDILEYNGAKWVNLPSSGDWLSQYLLLAGRAGGQLIGDGTAPTGGNTNSVAIKGITATPASFIIDQTNTLNHDPTKTAFNCDGRPTAAPVNGIFQVSADLTALAGTPGITTIIGVTSSGLIGWTSGTAAVYRALNLTANPTVSGTLVITTMTGAIFQASPFETAGQAARVATILGGRFIAVGTSSGNVGTGAAAALICAGVFEVTNRAKAATAIVGCQLKQAIGGVLAAVNSFVGYQIQTNTLDNANVVDWTGLQMANVTLPTGLILGLDIPIVKNRVAGLRIGVGVPAGHLLEIEPGTTTRAPILFTGAGTNLTAATAGAVEYDGSYIYATHGDAVRTKVVTQRGEYNALTQVAAIGATTIYTPPAAGYYVVNYTLECTTGDNVTPAGTIQFQVNHTDDIGATNQTGAALALTATGRDRGSFQVYSASGVISIQTNLAGLIGTAQYALRVRLVALG